MLACPARQDEPVAVGPVRVGRGVAQEPRPQDVGHRRRAHRGAGMTGVRLLHGVDRQGPDRVDGQLVEVGGDGHRAGSVRAGGSDCRRGVLQRTAAAPCRLSPALQAVSDHGCKPVRAILGACRHAEPSPPTGGRPRRPPRIVVVGDLMLDVVLRARARARGRHGRARLGVVRAGRLRGHDRSLAGPARGTSTLIAAVGRDAAGRALVEAVRADGVRVRAVRVAGHGPDGSASLVAPGGER